MSLVVTSLICVNQGSSAQPLLKLKQSVSQKPSNSLSLSIKTSPTVSCERCLIVCGDNLHLVCHDCFASIVHPPALPGAPSLTHSPIGPSSAFPFGGGHPDPVLPRLLALSAHVPGLHLSNEGRLGDKRQSFFIELGCRACLVVFSPLRR